MLGSNPNLRCPLQKSTPHLHSRSSECTPTLSQASPTTKTSEMRSITFPTEPRSSHSIKMSSAECPRFPALKPYPRQSTMPPPLPHSRFYPFQPHSIAFLAYIHHSNFCNFHAYISKTFQRPSEGMFLFLIERRLKASRCTPTRRLLRFRIPCCTSLPYS